MALIGFKTLSTVFVTTLLDLGLGSIIGVVSNYIFTVALNPMEDDPLSTQIIGVTSQFLFSMIALAEITSFFINLYGDEPAAGLLLLFITFIVQPGLISRTQKIIGELEVWLYFKLHGKMEENPQE